MVFNLEKSVQVLEKTPAALEAMLHALDDDWVYKNEGEQTWSPYDIVGHLIHGEKTDWIPRLEIIMAQQAGSMFEPFDRFAQFENSKGKNMQQLL
ncbi:MAG: DinB family protein, partial [Cyclobacteriaceae bacterium]|nr:DinB family protein [Cyclobacteriaceae bacterium]